MIAARRKVHLVHPYVANAIPARVVGWHRVSIRGGNEETAVVLQPSVVERSRCVRIVTLRQQRPEVVHVGSLTGAAGVPDGVWDLHNVKLIVFWSSAALDFAEKCRVAGSVLDVRQANLGIVTKNA